MKYDHQSNENYNDAIRTTMTRTNVKNLFPNFVLPGFVVASSHHNVNRWGMGSKIYEEYFKKSRI